MSELLLELFSEEIPARMQNDAATAIKEALTKKLHEEGLFVGEAQAFVTPRRVVIVIENVPETTKDRVIEKKGPRLDANQNAIDGFLKSTGLKLADLKTQDNDKGKFYIAIFEEKGKSAKQILPSAVSLVLENFVWPKSMRWGAHHINWVRPLQNILCLFSGEILPVKFGHITANNISFGHRFLAANNNFQVKNFKDYQEKLTKNFVILEQERRKAIIALNARAAAEKKGLTIKDDEKLLEEVTGLVEWPEILIGEIDKEFMNLPPEVLSTSMRAHQKYFSLLDKNGKLAPYFLLVSNIKSKDGGTAIIAGNQRVLRARLSDAKFFFEQDSKEKLETRIKNLSGITFHAKTGSYFDKINRMATLAKYIAKPTGVDVMKAEKAAILSKADLTTGMVGEFPELQGIMGGYYAKQSGEADDVAAAIREHYYYPVTYNNMSEVTKNKLSLVVALADKIDTLAGMFAAGEKPTGSKDPFALRRAALGIIRMVLENSLRFPLNEIFAHALGLYNFKVTSLETEKELMDFMVDRLKVYLKDHGIRHDLIAAIDDGKNKNGDLYFMAKRAEALASFVKSEDGVNLIAAYKRAVNIVKSEEKKDKISYDEMPSADHLKEEQEKNLFNVIETKSAEISKFLSSENIEEAMRSLSQTRKSVDIFFDKIMVNVEDKTLRQNRLRLLARLRISMESVANFSKIEG